MSSKRRTDMELAAWHAAQAERYKQRIAIRNSAVLGRMRRAAKLLRKVAFDLSAENANAALELARGIDGDITRYVNPGAGPTLPFDSAEDPDFEVKS